MREARLGDVVASMKNGIYKPASEYADDGLPCLRMYNIDAGSIVWRDIKRMRINDREFAEYGLHEGDLLVNRVNSRELVGKAACIPASLEPSVFESKNIRVRLDREKALPKFINYQLFARGSRHFANNAQQVVGMASISQGQLADFPIVITDLDEQHRIVAEIEKQFSRLDKAVANLQRVKAKIRRYAKAVFNAAADGTLWPLDGDRAAHEGLSASNWGHATLGDVAPVLDPNPSHRMPAYVAQGIPLISSENFVGEEGIDFEKGKQVGADTLTRQRALFAIEEGDFVLSRIGTIGKTRLLPLGRDYCLSHALVVIKVRVPHVDKHWLRYAISSDRVLHQAQSGVQSVGVPDLGMGKMRAFEIRIPPLTEQHRIVAEVDRRLSIVREVEAEVDANLKRAQALRQTLLDRAFGGASQSHRGCLHMGSRPSAE